MESMIEFLLIKFRASAGGAVDLHHAADLMEAAHDGGELLAVGDEDLEMDEGEAVRGGLGVEARDAGLRGREDGGDVEHEVDAVGICVILTADSVLLICCPPAPDER